MAKHIHIDPPTEARVRRGEVVCRTEPVAGYPTPRLIVHALVERPVERVWALIASSGDYAKYMPRVKEARELSRDGDVIRCQQTIEMPFPLKNLTSTTEARHTVIEGELYKREWRMISGDYKRNEGSWMFEPLDGDMARTLVKYEIHAEPKTRIPKKIQSLVQEKAMPKLIAVLRDNA